MTCVRACIEALGRAWFLLLPDEPPMSNRRLMLQLDELKYTDEADLLVANGELVACARVREEIVAGLGGVRRLPTGPTRLAHAVLSASGIKEAAQVYSLLSALAHGEAAQTLALQVEDNDQEDDFVTIGVPLHVAQVALRSVVKVVTLVMDELCRQFDVRAAQERWDSSRGRVHSSLEPLLARDDFPVTRRTA